MVQEKNMKITFLCGARDFHAMDWYRSSKKLFPSHDICILTDLIESEGFIKLINEKDKVFNLFILDKLLFKKFSRLGNIWRNLLKLIVAPIQVYKIKQFNRVNPNTVFFAHGMYYLFIAGLAKVNYIGTPQGSELLVRPNKSAFYRAFLKIGLKRAKAVTVDSESMRIKANELAEVNPIIIQNGIDMNAIIRYKNDTSMVLKPDRFRYVSIRGFGSTYRIHEILKSRNFSLKEKEIPLTFIYPFFDQVYKDETKKLFINSDNDLGYVARAEFYKNLFEAKVVFSIPISDSSPRSVYEAIFCGCIVVIAYNTYVELLPECMKERIVICNTEDPDWMNESLMKVEEKLKTNFNPDQDTVLMFDQENSLKTTFNLLLEI